MLRALGTIALIGASGFFVLAAVYMIVSVATSAFYEAQNRTRK